MNPRWIEGNDIRLLENGEEFFPRLFACIADAGKEVVLETFILFEDKVGFQLHQALVAVQDAATRASLVERGLRQARLFSWSRMAREVGQQLAHWAVELQSTDNRSSHG